MWKLLGVGSVVGVAATGVLIARNERERRAYTPDQVRSRLHERAAEGEGPALSAALGDDTDPED